MLNARQNKSVNRRSATLRNLYKTLKKASTRPYSNKEQGRSRIVVLQLRVVVHLLMSHSQSLQLHTAIAAAKLFVRKRFGEKICCIGL